MDEDKRPAPSLEVPPAIVAPRGRRAPLAALFLVVGAIAGAVASAQLAPPSIRTPAAVATPARPTGSPPSTTAAPSASAGLPPVAAVPPRLTPADLAEGVEDRSLDGRLVFIDGEIHGTPVPCGRDPASSTPGAPGCVEVVIPGVGPPVVLAPTAVPWRGDPPDGTWLVTVPADGALQFLGSLRPEDDIPDDASTLTARLLGGDLPPLSGSLFQVTGWLVTQPSAFLAADAPRSDGTLRSDRGGEVVIEEPVIDVDPEDAVAAGTFLLAPPDGCDPSAAWATCLPVEPWIVVARYEPGRSVRVQVP